MENVSGQDIILRDREIILTNICKELKKPRALLNLLDEGIVYPNSITMIQGQTGTHKSRLAASIVTNFIADKEYENSLGFKLNNIDLDYGVLYIDTERNLKYDLPYAIKQIAKEANIETNTFFNKLDVISLLNYKREGRIDSVKSYINSKINSNDKKHWVIVLDIITDFIGDINDSNQSLELVDYINKIINNEDVTIIAIIHENPYSEKARGHIGTEILNKASSILQIQQVKSTNNVYRIKNIKNRNDSKSINIYCKYSEEYEKLIKLSNEEIVALKNNSILNDNLIQCLIKMFNGNIEGIGAFELKTQLKTDLSKSTTTIDTLVRNALEAPLYYEEDNYVLKCEGNGKARKYFLSKSE